MKLSGFLLIAFGLLNIIFPDMLAYFLWALSIALGINVLIGGIQLESMKKAGKDHLKFGDYKIFR